MRTLLALIFTLVALTPALTPAHAFTTHWEITATNYCAALGWEHAICKQIRECAISPKNTIIGGKDPLCEDFERWERSPEGQKVRDVAFTDSMRLVCEKTVTREGWRQGEFRPQYGKWSEKVKDPECLKTIDKIEAAKPAMKKRVQEEFEQKRQERDARKQEEDNKPENRLQKMYATYLNIRYCYDVRKGFEHVFVNDLQMTDAKRYAAAIDKKLAVESREEVWSKAVADFNNSLAKMLITSPDGMRNALGVSIPQYCQMAYRGLQQTHEQLFPAAGMKRDF